MTDPNILRAAVTSVSPLITNQNVSPFFPAPPVAISDYLRDTKDLQFQSGFQLGDTLTLDLSKQATSLGVCRLLIQWPAVPVNPLDTGFVRLMDYVGYAVIREVRVKYFGNTIYRYGNPYLFTRNQKWYGIERKASVDENVQGNKTQAQRSFFLQNGGVTLTDLLLPNTQDTTQYLPIVDLAQKLTIEIDTDIPDNLLQTNSTNPGQYVPLLQAGIRFALRLDYFHTIDRVTKTLITKSKEANGIPYLISNKAVFQSYVVQVAPGVPSLEFRMLNKGVTKSYYFYFVPQRLLQTRFANDYFMIANNPAIPVPNSSPYEEILNFQMETNGVFLMRPIMQPFFNKFDYHSYYHSAFPGANLYFVSWSMNPEAENSALGNAAFANFDNPIKTIFFGPNGTGVDPVTQGIQMLQMQTLQFQYTYIQIQNGDILEVFV